MQNRSLSRELNSAILRLNAAQELVRQELLEVTHLSDLLQDLIIWQNPYENYNILPVAHVIRVAQTQQPLDPEPETQDLRPTLLGRTPLEFWIPEEVNLVRVLLLEREEDISTFEVQTIK